MCARPATARQRRSRSSIRGRASLRTNAAKVGQRFYRILGTEEFGSGLGLSIVKRIAELHGASVRLADGEQGKGLSVTVSFPR